MPQSPSEVAVTNTPFAVACPDLPYSVDAMRERIATLHAALDAQAFLTAAGGSLHPDHGGNWERSQAAASYLVVHEPMASSLEVSKIDFRYKALPPLTRSLVDAYVVTAGVLRPIRSPLITVGELLVWEWFIVHVLSDDALKALVDAEFGFSTEVLHPSAEEGEEGEVGDAPSPSRPLIVHTMAFTASNKITWLVCEGCEMEMASTSDGRKCPVCTGTMFASEDQSNIVNVPADGIDLLAEVPDVELTDVPKKKADILAWVADPRRAFLALTAEARKAKPGKALAKDLAVMAQAFEVPDEWLIEERK